MKFCEIESKPPSSHAKAVFSHHLCLWMQTKSQLGSEDNPFIILSLFWQNNLLTCWRLWMHYCSAYKTQVNNSFSSVREITKSSSTFSATNISSNITWLFQLHDKIQMKSNYTWINYDHDNVSIKSHMMIYNSVQNKILLPNLVAFISQKETNVWFFDYHLLICSVRKMVLKRLMQNIDYVFVVSISSNRTLGIIPH